MDSYDFNLMREEGAFTQAPHTIYWELPESHPETGYEAHKKQLLPECGLLAVLSYVKGKYIFLSFFFFFSFMTLVVCVSIMIENILAKYIYKNIFKTPICFEKFSLLSLLLLLLWCPEWECKLVRYI